MVLHGLRIGTNFVSIGPMLTKLWAIVGLKNLPWITIESKKWFGNSLSRSLIAKTVRPFQGVDLLLKN